ARSGVLVPFSFTKSTQRPSSAEPRFVLLPSIIAVAASNVVPSIIRNLARAMLHTGLGLSSCLHVTSRRMAHSAHALARVAVLTVSDTRTPADDESGRICKEFVVAAGHEIVAYGIIKDDAAEVEAECRRLAPEVDAILLNGGTGVAPRDTTIE